MTRTQERLLLITIFVAAVGTLAVYAFWDKLSRTNQPPPPAPLPAPTSVVEPPSVSPRLATQPASRPSESAPASRPAPGPADEAFRTGMELYRANRWIPARNALSQAFFSGGLTAPQKAAALNVLTELAERTIFSSTVYEGDPYGIVYTIRPGELLAKMERDMKLHVPPQLLLKINGLSDAAKVRSGQMIKLLQGPFHAVVDKKNLTLDFYLQRDESPKVFVKRITVGLGRNGSTPVGTWRVSQRGKLLHPVYYPAVNSPNRARGPIPYGQPGYAFGTMGMWIGLEGTDENTSRLTDYGIHSTNDPASIGKEGSEGCIRLSDGDIELAYSLLYPVWSTVQIVP